VGDKMIRYRSVLILFIFFAFQFTVGCYRFDNSTPTATAHSFANYLIENNQKRISQLISPELSAQDVLSELAPWFKDKEYSRVMFTKKEYEEEAIDKPYIAVIRPEAKHPLTVLYLTIEPGNKGYVVTKYSLEHQ
jgi:hypothetical protein